MALFDFLKKVQKVVETVSSVAEQLQDIKDSSQPVQINPAHTSIPNGAPAEDCYSFQGSVDEYFAQILSANFPQFRIFRNESMAGSMGVPVSFLLCKDDEPKLAVILCGSQEYRTRRVQNTVDACTARHIPVQRYYREFRNNAGYIVNRVSSAL